jgi:glutaredoxin
MALLRTQLGKVLRPVLESTALDRVRYVAPVRRFARDWAIAFGFWDDGILEAAVDLKPMDVASSAAWTKGQASLTLYVDGGESATERLKELLAAEGVSCRVVDISGDDASRKWLAEEHQGARPPQLFADGRRVGGIAEVQALREQGKLRPFLVSQGGGQGGGS